jgi:DNA-binding winged helix-turn-helix (wHTH) protein
MQEPQTLVFGPFCLDRHDERLWRGQEVLLLYPKSFAVLCCLVTQAGQLVTKDALLEAVWPKTAVSESALTVAIRHLGRVLGDRARTPQFIETVHRRGYRFMAPVAVAEPSPQRHQTAGTWRLPQPVACVQSALFVGREGELTQMYQWSDRATLEWLAYVARRPDPARLLILGTYRPVGAIVRPSVAGRPHGAPAARPVCGVGAGLSIRNRGHGLPLPAVRGHTASGSPGAGAASRT